MVLQMHKGVFDPEKAEVIFPTTLAKVQTEMRGLEEFGKSYGVVRIVSGEGPTQLLTGRVKVDDLNTEAGIQNLNRLAEAIDNMSDEKLKLLNGALALERAANLDDVLRVTDSLEQYELFPQIRTDEDLGHFLVDTSFITGKFSFPEKTRPYLDYAKIGAEQRDTLGGAYTTHGFVKRREEVPVQAEVPKAMLLTLTASEQSYPLVLPASEKQLEHAKKSLGIEDFAQAVIANVEYTAPYLNQLIPMDSITVEDANEMALCLQRLKKDGEIMKYCAALEVEEPSTFTEALDMAIDIDDYELISDSEREYSRQALRRMGANDEVLEAIEGHTDFDLLGSEMMEEDGVRQTGFGLARRLSKPFPPAPEIGQAMM
ncbi:hypothetical protein D1641_13470 [Colidextribacter sp. OB.20]|uniref:DUF6329 domain-containing protein n=1 Tax=Colidextribacter sp. OB.20 TaxID=2304568 RepID=UPI001369FF76|nr:DUF6329 domain-containing protein [Colidextribacter sp. OB.20]NBI11011.1 hypothetical protein [Colidextribacter sp. OB.20]